MIGKKYRPDYMEDAITKYLTLCQTPEFAVRATLFDGRFSVDKCINY